MEALVRLTERRTHKGGTNPVGEIICVRDDGWPWSATERSTFRVVQINGVGPDWFRSAMQGRLIRFVGPPDKNRYGLGAAIAAMRDIDGNGVTESGVAAIRQRLGMVDA